MFQFRKEKASLKKVLYNWFGLRNFVDKPANLHSCLFFPCYFTSKSIIPLKSEAKFCCAEKTRLTYIQGQITGNQKQSTPSLKQLSMIGSRLESLKRFTRIYCFVLTLFCFFVSNDSTDIKVLLHNDHKEVGIGNVKKNFRYV